MRLKSNFKLQFTSIFSRNGFVVGVGVGDAWHMTQGRGGLDMALKVSYCSGQYFSLSTLFTERFRLWLIAALRKRVSDNKDNVKTDIRLMGKTGRMAVHGR